MLCALPLENIVETLRPLPVSVLPGVPDFVAGMAIIRGTALPVIAMDRLLATTGGEVGRFVVVRTGARQLALAVDRVIGVRALGSDTFRDLAPLLRNASREAVAEIGALDGELLVLLEATRIVPEDVFAAIAEQAAAS